MLALRSRARWCGASSALQQRILHRAHVAPTWVIRTQFGDYVQASARVGGASLETRDDAELNNWHARPQRGSGGVSRVRGIALWSHLIRRSSVALDERGR